MTNDVKQLLRLTWLGFGLIMCIVFTAWATLTGQAWWLIAVNISVGIYTVVRLSQLLAHQAGEDGPEQAEKTSGD